jgi:hypothetical protein
MYTRKRNVNASSTHFYARTCDPSARGNKPLSSKFPTRSAHYISAFFLSSPVIFLLKQQQQKKKQIGEENLSSRNPLSNDIDSPSVGRNRRLDRRDDSARG